MSTTAPITPEQRRAAHRAACSRAYASLEPGDIIAVADVPAGGNGVWPAHYAQVMARPDGDMGLRGLNGGGAMHGPLPFDRNDWWLVGHAAQGVHYHGPTHMGGGFSDPAASVARARTEFGFRDRASGQWTRIRRATAGTWRTYVAPDAEADYTLEGLAGRYPELAVGALVQISRMRVAA